MTKKKPNILLITCDQLRYDYIGAAGNQIVKTPHIDRLAQEGCNFVNAYSPNPVCIPARYNLITGLTARHHGFDDNYFGAQAKACPYALPTFAQLLGDDGYETAAIGKMHFQPARRAAGFDYFYNMDELPACREEDDYAMYLKEVGLGHLQSLHGVRTCLYMQPQRSNIPQAHHGSTWVADRSIDFLRRTHDQKPFLLWSGFIHPHPPLDVPEEWAELYKDQLPPPVKSNTPLSELAEENRQLGCLEDAAALQRMRELYAAAISFTDQQIGRILDELEQQGLAENTLVIFTSDHGEMLGDLGTFQKFLPYDASCKIPMLMRFPGRIAPGSKDTRFVDLNDLLPTFLDAAGAAYPALYDLPGESVLVQDGVKNRSLQYVEHQHGSKRWCSIRNERFKYVHYYGDDEQLFDLVDDPQETTNLLYQNPTEQQLAIRARLRNSLLCYEARYGLAGYVQNGEFIAQPHYRRQPYYETNFPLFSNRLTAEDAAMLGSYEAEILAAIRDEPTVKLRHNHTAEILGERFSEAQLAHLFAQADAQGN